MALPSPNLDDRRFQQFVDDAKRYIQQRAPEWTDHNVSDPGVTLVETVAHMADQIVYRLNRVPEKNHLAFLDLIGITLFPPSAARADVTFWLSAPQQQPVVLATGTEVATARTQTEDAVVFATERELTVVPCELSYLVIQRADQEAVDRTSDLVESKDVHCFAEAPNPGDRMLFGLSAAVPECVVVLELDSQVDGVGVDPRQPPLAWEAWTADGWIACDVERDTTGGLNRPGEVVLHVPGGHALSRTGRREAGWLRCRVTEPAQGQPFYTTSPTIRSAEAFSIGGTTGVVHAETVRDEALGESTGLPGHRLRLANSPVVGGAQPCSSRSPSATAGSTGRPSATSPPRAPPTGTSPWTRPPARSPSARPSVNRTAPCASTGPCRPRARPSGPAATVRVAGRRATSRGVPSRCCATRSPTSPTSSTGRPRAVGSTVRPSRRRSAGRPSR